MGVGCLGLVGERVTRWLLLAVAAVPSPPLFECPASTPALQTSWPLPLLQPAPPPSPCCSPTPPTPPCSWLPPPSPPLLHPPPRAPAAACWPPPLASPAPTAPPWRPTLSRRVGLAVPAGDGCMACPEAASSATSSVSSTVEGGRRVGLVLVKLGAPRGLASQRAILPFPNRPLLACLQFNAPSLEGLSSGANPVVEVTVPLTSAYNPQQAAMCLRLVDGTTWSSEGGSRRWLCVCACKLSVRGGRSSSCFGQQLPC